MAHWSQEGVFDISYFEYRLYLSTTIDNGMTKSENVSDRQDFHATDPLGNSTFDLEFLFKVS